MHPDVIHNKIMLREQAKLLVDRWKFKDEKIVFTNGCFDILHRGHLEYLLQASSLGHKLIIGLNSDESVSRLKGPSRPVNKIEDRAFALASLRCVDLVVPFGEDTPFELIEFLQPNVLVKGGDYTIDDIVGAKETLQRGGRVEVLMFKDGYSTTSLIEKMKKG
jgi:D-glycero-beta-D-manno-heptose 1-phosphate adenylyltransferase